VSCCADCAGQRGSRCLRLHKQAVVTSRRTTGFRVHFDGEDQAISIRAHSVRVRPGLLSVEQVIVRLGETCTPRAVSSAQTRRTPGFPSRSLLNNP
jgi:hypothetical protein